MLRRAIRRLRRSDELADLYERVRTLQDRVLLLEAQAKTTAGLDRDGPGVAPSDQGLVTVTVPRSVAPFLSDAMPGHFYSPVPNLAEIEAQAERLFDPAKPLPGIDLRVEEQLALFRTLARLAREAPFEATPGGSARYGLDNPNYGIGDASMLAALLRHLRPRRYFEVGSGFTTALALDVRDRFLGGELAVTAVEPYPELLQGVLRPDDEIEVIAHPVQSVPLQRFAALEAGDILFIDSSHVLKTGSDVQFLYGSVLPVLADGVYVHVHDVFWPFEYLRHWVAAGRAWNECYVLQAFLAFNGAFEIVLWNHFLGVEHSDVVAAELPQMLENPGGSIWLRRTPRPAAGVTTGR